MPASLDEDMLLLLRSFANRPALLRAGLREQSPAALLATLDEAELAPHRNWIERDLRWLEAPGHDVLFWHDEDYPEPLREISDAPFALWLDGNRAHLQGELLSVAMVGARKASQYGRRQAHDLAAQLSRQGLVITSGLALGIDAAAHEGALASGGTTFAVLGTGCDEIYPRRHWRLADRIRETGLILSEFPLGTLAFPGNFPRRNRIVTGLARATIVVEAALRSGSLVSARLALAQGRDVMAVPGLVTQSNAHGCHQLIRDGAALIESAQDVLRELGLLEDSVICSGFDRATLSESEQTLIGILADDPSTVDELVSLLGQAVDEITVNLVSLEVMGLIYSEGGVYHLAAVESSH